MPAPLRWDTPGLKYDSGLHWDGVQPDPPKPKSMNTKAIIDFRPYREGDLSPVAQHIHDQLTLNAAVFGTLPVTLAALQTLISDYDAKLAAKEGGAKADTLAFNAARLELEDALGKLGNHVNNVANGDPVIVAQSGFPSYQTGHAEDNTPPDAPTNLTLTHGKVTGTVQARYKPDRSPSTNEIQINLVNPANEADWHTKIIYTGGKAMLTGLTPGTQIWVRVRTIGIGGVMGAWSDPATIWVA